MDYLPLDHLGLVPSIDFRQIQDNFWIGLNAPCELIPSEACSPPQHVASAFKATGPMGMLLEMEWALDANWFDPDAGWCVYFTLLHILQVDSG